MTQLKMVKHNPIQWGMLPHRIGFFVSVLVLLFVVVPGSTSIVAQGNISELLAISVDAGYDGRFRANQWMPLRVTVENQGSAIQGKLVVRPETSGSAIPNAFSTPVDLPSGGVQTIFLYIIARDNASTIRVELLDQEESVVGSQDVNVRDILGRDTLYAVVTQETTNIPDFSELGVGGYEAFQAVWTADNVPARSGALDAINAMLFTNVDTGSLSTPQQRAVETWVIGGGHLIVTGGAGWQLTAAAFEDILPLVPTSSETTEDLEALAQLAGDYDESLEGEVIVALGDLAENTEVLAENREGTPLVVRRQVGNGIVDYVAVDPSSQPLREWDDIAQLWFTLLTSTDARPSWSYGFANWDRATASVEILPGINLLPAVLGLIAFLTAYIGIIGPINYIVLSRLNKREYAWVTIPIFIVIFSVLAWSVGFEVRGNRATLSRLTVVQTWPDTEEAHVDQLVGLLAPRRGNYTLSMMDDRLMHPYSESFTNPGLLRGQVQTGTEIQQTERFAAVDFPVDASFIASFSTRGVVERPDIGGRVVLVYDEQLQNFESLQGSIRNDSEMVLFDPVILSRGTAFYLGRPIDAGEVITLDRVDLLLSGNELSIPSRLEYAAADEEALLTTGSLGFASRYSPYLDSSYKSAADILGSEDYQAFSFAVSLSDDAETQETRRRQAFLDSFVIDQFASTARGNRVYLAAWTQDAPTEEDIDGAGFDVVDTTLYIIELEVEREDSGNDTVLITQDQFIWTTRERVGMDDAGVSELSLRTDTELVYRFTPVPDARLTEVDALIINVNRTQRTGFSDGAVELWDWAEEAWEVVSIDLAENAQTVLSDPARFIGPQNAVEMRITRMSSGGSVFLERIGVEQLGRF